MSRWITISACLSVLILTAFPAHAAERPQLLRLAQADQSDLPRNIELKEGAKVAEDAKGSDEKTRQIVTEGKEETPAAAAPADAAKEAAPADAAAKDAAPPAKEEAAPPAAAAKEGAPFPGDKPGQTVVVVPPPGGPPPGDIVVAVQTELQRVGCSPGEIDGVWGGQSRGALAAYGHFAKVDVGDLAPTPEILAGLKGKTGVICPVEAEGAPPPPGHAGPPPDEGPPPTYGGGGGYGGGYGGGGGY